MTWVKVCGLTRPQDVRAAEVAGADALGFVLVPSSPRFITVGKAAELIRLTKLPAFVLTKDLFAADLIATALATGATGVQPYGRHAPEAAQSATEVGLRVLRPVDPGEDLASIPGDQYPLLDSKNRAGEGRGGRMVDPSWLPNGGRDYVLAGGLTPENVADVISSSHPWGVDVSSGVESRPGVKDEGLIRLFVEAVRNA